MIRMKQSTTHRLIVVGCALALQVFFLAMHLNTPHFYVGSVTPHGEVAYNLYQYNSIKINPERMLQIDTQQYIENKGLISYDTVDHTKFGPPTCYRNTVDTIGYGVLLGLLWKCTHSMKYRDILLLQIIIFCLLMLLIYQIACWWFDSKTTALYCAIALLLFFPLIVLNTRVHRDIWAYYGTVLLLYTFTRLLTERRTSAAITLLLATAIAICQWIRPTLFVTVGVVMLGSLLFAWQQRKMCRTLINRTVLIACANVLIFWVPFMAYNFNAYHRLFVGPTGLGIIWGLGEFSNTWNLGTNDVEISTYVSSRYPVTYGTQEFDDAAKELAFRYIGEQPGYFIRCICKRLPDFFLRNFGWLDYPADWYAGTESMLDKLKKSLTSPVIFLDWIVRLAYIRLYLLLSYLGLIVLFRRRKLMASYLTTSVILSVTSVILSHIEDRYLIPFVAVLAFPLGYLVHYWAIERRLQKTISIPSTSGVAHAR